ncbi:MAG: metallophosphoesterase [Candidatus Aenigmatarchaeota archaeon]
MRIAVVSDLHLGFAPDAERENDCYEALQEFFDKTMAQGADLILIAGDLFDSKSPRTETWAKTLKSFNRIKRAKSETTLVEGMYKDVQDYKAHDGIPIVAIHGTHERRGRDLLNPVQVLEHAGLLIHIDRNGVIFEKDVRVAVQGLSGVPELFAKDALKKYAPQPTPGAFNIFMLHQSIEPYINSFDTTLKMNDLPKGFDVIVEGHVHFSERVNMGDCAFILPGSTVATQINKSESEISKGFWMIDVKKSENGFDKRLEFIKLESQRRVFYSEFAYDGNEESLKGSIRESLSEILRHAQKKIPAIRIRVTGGSKQPDFRDIEKEFASKCLLSFSFDLKDAGKEQKISLMKEIREGRMSVSELGMALLQKNLEILEFKNFFDVETAYSLLSESELEQAISLLIGRQKTLKKFGGME